MIQEAELTASLKSGISEMTSLWRLVLIFYLTTETCHVIFRLAFYENNPSEHILMLERIFVS